MKIKDKLKEKESKYNMKDKGMSMNAKKTKFAQKQILAEMNNIELLKNINKLTSFVAPKYNYDPNDDVKKNVGGGVVFMKNLLFNSMNKTFKIDKDTKKKIEIVAKKQGVNKQDLELEYIKQQIVKNDKQEKKDNFIEIVSKFKKEIYNINNLDELMKFKEEQNKEIDDDRWGYGKDIEKYLGKKFFNIIYGYGNFKVIHNHEVWQISGDKFWEEMGVLKYEAIDFNDKDNYFVKEVYNFIKKRFKNTKSVDSILKTYFIVEGRTLPDEKLKEAKKKAQSIYNIANNIDITDDDWREAFKIRYGYIDINALNNKNDYSFLEKEKNKNKNENKNENKNKNEIKIGGKTTMHNYKNIKKIIREGGVEKLEKTIYNNNNGDGFINIDKVVELYGFKKVIFGNYVNKDKERKYFLENTLFAFEDLKKAIGIDVVKLNKGLKKIGFNSLGIMFGASGSGRQMASYYSIDKEINLTKTKGDGSLAHEFGHFIDNYIGLLEGSKIPNILYTETEKGKKSIVNVLVNRGGDGLVELKKNVSITAELKGNKLFPVGIQFEKLENILTQYEQLKIKYNLNNREDKEEDKEEDRKNRIKAYINYKLNSTMNSRKETPTQLLNMIINGLIKDEIIKKGETITLDIYRTTNKTDYYNNSFYFGDGGKQGGNDKKYWSSNAELFARAFEAYVEDKLKEKGMKNNFLVASNEGKELYPQGEERIKINKAIDNLLKKHNIL